MRVEVYEDSAGMWRWRLRAKNGRIVAESGEGYSAKRKVLDACKRMADGAGYRSHSGTNDICEAFCEVLFFNGR